MNYSMLEKCLVNVLILMHAICSYYWLIHQIKLWNTCIMYWLPSLWASKADTFKYRTGNFQICKWINTVNKYVFIMVLKSNTYMIKKNYNVQEFNCQCAEFRINKNLLISIWLIEMIYDQFFFERGGGTKDHWKSCLMTTFCAIHLIFLSHSIAHAKIDLSLWYPKVCGSKNLKKINAFLLHQVWSTRVKQVYPPLLPSMDIHFFL